MKKRTCNKTAALCGLILLAISSAVLGGCGKSEILAPDAKTVLPSYPESIDQEKDWDKWRKNQDENEVPQSFIESQSGFTFTTARELLAGREENLVYSPASLYYALSLAASGTRGETAGELYRFLGVEDPDSAAEYAGRFYRILYCDSSISQMRMATSLWVDQSMSLKEEFTKTAAARYYASLHTVDFSDEKTGKEMGKWVKENTKGTIVPEIRVEAQQLMHLMNTVYFYDEWIDRFNQSSTKKGAFHLADGTTEETDFMNATYGSHNYRNGDGFVSSSLGLKENGSMVFVLPDEGVPVDSLFDTPDRLKEVLEGGESHMGEVVFQVPKFTADTHSDIREVMIKLGITGIFEDGEFSGMTDNKGIYISSITQDGHIAIDEKGVEASAFTDITYAGAALPEGRADLILDRPFLYGIEKNGVWLFIGVCDNP